MWQIVYRKAVEDDRLFFPEKLSHEFLDTAKRTMGLYKFTNQYMNEIIPSELQTFKREWVNYYDSVPKNVKNFIFVDPALSEADTADYTAFVLVSVDEENRWYVRNAARYRFNPTQLISKLFEWNDVYKPDVIGIEQVAYQKALLYFLDEEMRRRSIYLPVKGITPPNDRSKQTRILSMVPRFEWKRMFLNKGLVDLEHELMQFPRGGHDDLIDALASIEYIYSTPKAFDPESVKLNPHHKDYEKRYIKQLKEGRREEKGTDPSEYGSEFY